MKQYKKWISISAVFVVIAVIILGGYMWQQSKLNRSLSIIYIPKTVDGTNDFWTSLISGTRMAAKEYNACLLYTSL